ncbi:MAG: F0F1 ATP synthase subunit A [Candidatus Eisenbacteria bacterium]|nr:F0F1 ATP synthase subunit A [Candidatus Eisenbacteria bacterium]
MHERPETHENRAPCAGSRRARRQRPACALLLLCLALLAVVWIGPAVLLPGAHGERAATGSQPASANPPAHATREAHASQSAPANPGAHPTQEPHASQPAPGTPGKPAPSHAGHAAAGHAADEHGAHEAHPELPNLIGVLYRAVAGEEGAAPGWLVALHHFEDLFFALLAAGLLILIVRLAIRRMNPRDPVAPQGRLQTAVELLFGGFRDFVLGILGPEGARYVPFLGTLFLYIWCMNLFGLVPLMKSPTAVLNTTGALAVCVFGYVQWTGMRRLGPLGYLRHLAGDPQDLVGWILVPLMLPLHIISEFAKPVSLALRLFGNILGEDVLLGVFAGLGVAALAFSGLPAGLPLHLPFILLALLMSTVQALVFTLLSTIYIMQVLPHDASHASEEVGPQAAAEEGTPAA